MGRVVSDGMFIFANLIFAVAQVLDYVLWGYMWILIARTVISLWRADETIPVVRFLYNVTEPVLIHVRRRLPVSSREIDFSPLVVLIGAVFIQRFLVYTLYDLANALR